MRSTLLGVAIVAALLHAGCAPDTSRPSIMEDPPGEMPPDGMMPPSDPPPSDPPPSDPPPSDPPPSDPPPSDPPPSDPPPSDPPPSDPPPSDPPPSDPPPSDPPPIAPGAVGGACASDADCGDDGACLPASSGGEDTGFVDGYCVMVGCGSDSPCPGDSECFLLGSDMVPACLATCTGDSDCRAGYLCDADSTCWPGCRAGTCPGGFTCGADAICVTDGGPGPDPDPSGECSPRNPTGTCPAGRFCDRGTCVAAPDCDADPFEPNDSRARATTLTIGGSMGAGRCAGDEDWYRIDVPAGRIVTVTFHVPRPTVANLDVYAYESDGTELGARVADVDFTPTWARSYDTDEESFGFYSPSGTTTYYVKVTGATASASGSYTISSHQVTWTDGVTCSGAGFSSTECTSGRRGAQTLIAYPFPHDDDPYGMHVFDSVSNYRFLRRETMMAVRYAIREVARQFPRTGDLGLIDMCQRDGITPGYDIGDPRHPETTHDQGGNIDIAYYSTMSDNHARTVCDGSGGSHDGAFCTSAARTRHVVDLPRQVYFIVALARTGRLRVVGIDKVIGPLLLAEAQRMRDAGTITAAEYTSFERHSTWGDGWPYHHHHIHVSMQWL